MGFGGFLLYLQHKVLRLHTAYCPVWLFLSSLHSKLCSVPLGSSGYRMSAPQHCPEDIFKIMTKCWDYKPENRPKFSELQKELTVIKRKITQWRNSANSFWDLVLQQSDTVLINNEFILHYLQQSSKVILVINCFFKYVPLTEKKGKGQCIPETDTLTKGFISSPQQSCHFRPL